MSEGITIPPDSKPEFRNIPCPYCGTILTVPPRDNGQALRNHLLICPNNPDKKPVVRKKGGR